MSQRLSNPSGYSRASLVLNAVVTLSQASDSVEAAVQAWNLIVLDAEVLLLPHQDSVAIAVPN